MLPKELCSMDVQKRLLDLTHLHSERPKEAWRNISSTKAFFWKHLNEKCWSEDKQQISFKYFVKVRFIPKLFSKVWK